MLYQVDAAYSLGLADVQENDMRHYEQRHDQHRQRVAQMTPHTLTTQLAVGQTRV